VAATHRQLTKLGVILTLCGLVIATISLISRSDKAGATTHSFEGNCISLTTAGVCVLDEPEGQNPAVHGLVSYQRTPTAMTFTINAIDSITEVQICMQTSGPFAEGANVCAGSHGDHVAFTHVGSVYTVDLVAAHLSETSPLYWTLHVVAGGRTLQVIGQTSLEEPTTTTSTTAPPTTTSTTQPPVTTTTSTTQPPVTTSSSTTQPPVTTTTSTTQPPVTTTTSTTQPPVTTSSSTTQPPVTTTTSTVVPSSSTTSSSSTTTTPIGVQVLPERLARTGGPHWWGLLLGAALMLVGVTMVLVSRVLDHEGAAA
jgi:hypothetical protein